MRKEGKKKKVPIKNKTTWKFQNGEGLFFKPPGNNSDTGDDQNTGDKKIPEMSPEPPIKTAEKGKVAHQEKSTDNNQHNADG